MERNEEHSEQHLANCGWAAMQQLLDREMPVATTAGRSGYYYRGLVLLLLLLSFSMGLWYGRHGMPDNTVLAQPAAKLISTVSPAKPAPTVIVELPTESPALQPAYYNSLLLPAAFWVPASEPYIAATPAVATQTITSAFTESSTALFSSVAPTQTPSVLYPQQPLADVSDLLKTYAAPKLVQVLPDGPLPPLAKQPNVKPKPQLWSIGLMTGLLSLRGEDFSGWTAGVNVDWQPFQKIGLRGSAMYVYHHRLIQEVKTVYMPFNQYDQVWRELYNQPAPASIVANALSTDIELPVLGTHRAEGALSMFWNFLPRTRLYWGAYGGRTMGVSIARPRIEPDALSAAADVDKIAKNPVLNDAVSDYVAQQLPTWFYGWTSGMSYAPMRRFELSLSYQRTWPQLRRNAEKDAYRWNPGSGFNRFFRSTEGDFPGRIQLSATYKLK